MTWVICCVVVVFVAVVVAGVCVLRVAVVSRASSRCRVRRRRFDRHEVVRIY
jgi:hypothetical protein